MKQIDQSTLTPDTTFADTANGVPVTIDFEQLIGEHTLIAAKTGNGKSVLVRKMEELALANAYPIIVFDSDGDMASLRDAAPNGIFVFGGVDGDPDITIEQGIRQLEQIIAARASVIFSINALDKEQQDTVVKRVLTLMLKLPAHLHHPYLVVIDEVQRFAPERGSSPAAKAIVRAVKEGRRLGITVVVASQRVADVSKSVTSQMTNRMFGHFSDASDRRRVAEELGLSPRATAFLSAFGKGDFLVRGAAFGGEIDKVRVRLPVSGKSGKSHLVERQKAPLQHTDDLRSQLVGHPAGTVSVPNAARAASTTALSEAVRLDVRSESDGDEASMQAVLLSILAQQGRSGMAKDALALLAATTERRGSFKEAIANLLAGKLIGLATGTKLRITASGLAAVEGALPAKAPFELLAALRAGRAAADERIIACLSAAGHVPLDMAEVRARTGLGPRVAKAALQRLKRDCWVIERRGAFATSPALASLIRR